MRTVVGWLRTFALRPHTGVALAAHAPHPLDVEVEEGRNGAACDIILQAHVGLSVEAGSRERGAERGRSSGEQRKANGAKDAGALTAMMSIVPVLLRGAAHAGPRRQAGGEIVWPAGPI